MADQLGPTYAPTWACYTVLAELDGRTVEQALADGEPAKDVWRAVHAHLGLPPADR